MKTSTTERKIVPYKREGNLALKREKTEPFGLLRREIDQLFDDFTRGFTLEPFRMLEGLSRKTFRPVVDVTEADKSVKVTVELPGMDEKDIELSVKDGQLTIRGEKHEEKEEKKRGHYRMERSFGEFMRTVVLPVGVDTDKVTAEFKKGVLSVTIPRTREARTEARTIPIKAQ